MWVDICVNNRNLLNMRTLLLGIALFVSAIAAAQVPSVIVENAKGESFNTKTLLDEGTPMIVSYFLLHCCQPHYYTFFY